MARILVSEDEQIINDLICRNLQLVGHTTESCLDGITTFKTITSSTYDLVLLDVMLPGMTGFEIKNKINADIPVIFVTAKSGLSNRLEGLGLGADDYITKPFEILELLARVETVLRRTHKQQQVFEHAGVRVELDTHQVFLSGKEVSLTPKEFELLEVLIVNRNLALSRDKLLELVWGYDFEGESRTVDMHILKLRKKLNWEDVIQTVYKMGYRLNMRV